MATLAFSRSSVLVLAMFLLWNFSLGHLKCEALVLEEKFSGEVATEMEVNLPAKELWAVYRSPDYLKILARSRPNTYTKISYISGHGDVGTIVKYTGAPGPGTQIEYWYENITKIDDKAMTRVQTQIKGGFRRSGFGYFASEIQVTKKTKTSSVIRYSFLFELEEESLSNVTLVMRSWDPAIIIADYVNSRRPTPVVLRKEFSGGMVADMHVNLPANKLWHEYRRLNFPLLLLKLMSYFYKQIKFENGNGEPGTKFNITLQPAYGSFHYVEQNIKIDDKEKTRAIRFVEGPPLDSGLTEFINAFIIIPETGNSSVIRALGNFTARPESLYNISSLVRPIWDHGIAMAKYTLSQIS